MPQTATPTASHICTVADCILAQPLTVDQLTDLHNKYATTEYMHDIEDGHTSCDAFARSVQRLA